MQNKALDEIKASLHEIEGQPQEDVRTSGETQLQDDVIPLGKSDIKSNDGFNLLGSILETAFFYTLFEHIACRQFSSKTRQLRVVKMKVQHPHIYQFCIVADVFTRIVVVIAIVAAAIYSVYKVLR